MLIDREYHLRENRKLKRRLSQAKLQQKASLEDIDYHHPRGLNKANMMELSKLQWIQQHQNLILTGKTGSGKTYLSCAIANTVCLRGFSAKYFRLPRLWDELRMARASGTYPKLLSQIAKIDLIILDDWGIKAPNIEQRQDLLELLEDRYQLRSTIVTSQLPVTHWHTYLNDATLADAILDRLIHNSIRLELKGVESMRKKIACRQKEQNE